MKNLSVPLLLISIMILGCTRNEQDAKSVVSVVAPSLSQKGVSGLSMTPAVPAGKKACFAIDAQGPGLPGSQRSTCAPTLGVTSGFVEERAVMSVELTKGEARVFRLLILMVGASESCPALNSAYLGSGTPFANVFVGGTVGPVSIVANEETIVMNMTYNGSQSSIAQTESLGACLADTGPAQLRGMLYASGRVTNAVDVPFDNPSDALSSPTFESVWKTDPTQNGAAGFGAAAASSVISSASDDYVADQFLYSFTRKPDSLETFALSHDGKVVRVNSSGSTSLTTATCPFATCEVPVWMQSISAGKGSNLYALDHAGNIYLMTSVGPSSLSQSVSVAVSQVIYY